MPRKLDPKVAAMLPNVYTAADLEYAKGVVSGEIKVEYFKAKDIPEKKEVPEAFKKRNKARKKTNNPARRRPTGKGDKNVLRGLVLDFLDRSKDAVLSDKGAMVKKTAAQFNITTANARYYIDVFNGQR